MRGARAQIGYNRSMNPIRGKLYGVSVGPGDPGLLTLQAASVLRGADCIAAPAVGSSRRIALSIVQGYLEGKQVLDCPTPMTRDKQVSARAYEKIAEELSAVLDEGKSVAFITLGDASIYSTWSYVQKRMEERGYESQVVPGVPSFCAAAATLGEPLCAGDEQLLVVPASSGDVPAALDVPGTKVFMKAGSKLAELQDAIRRRSATSSLVACCGLPDERVIEDFNAAEDIEGYMSVVVARSTCTPEEAERGTPAEAKRGTPAGAEHPDAALPATGCGSRVVGPAPAGEPQAGANGDCPQPSSAFFQNLACEYFPCHEGVEPTRFNCLLCYCPLYALGERCGGDFGYAESGVKDCSGCTLPHEGENGVHMVRRRFADIAALAKGGADGRL